jgi:hypothetical protein
MNIFDSIKSHARLPVGWRNGKGGPLSERVIKTAQQLVHGILSDGWSEDDLEDFPLEDGRLLVAFYSEIDYQFLISTDGLIRVTIEQDGRHLRLADRSTIKLAIQLLTSRSACPLFTTFTSETLVNGSVISAEEPWSQTKGERFQLFLHHALGSPQVTLASMEGDFIQKLSETPSFLSNWKMGNYRSTRPFNSKRQNLEISATTTSKDVPQKTLGISLMRSWANDWQEYPSVTGGPLLQQPTKCFAASKMSSSVESPNDSITELLEV